MNTSAENKLNTLALISAIKRGSHVAVGKMAAQLVSEGNEDWILQAIQTVTDERADKEKQIKTVKALAPYWRFEEHSQPVRDSIFSAAIKRQQWHLIPALVDIGYSYSDSFPQTQDFINKSILSDIGLGIKPNLDYFGKDLLVGDNATNHINILARELFSRPEKLSDQTIFNINSLMETPSSDALKSIFTAQFCDHALCTSSLTARWEQTLKNTENLTSFFKECLKLEWLNEDEVAHYIENKIIYPATMEGRVNTLKQLLNVSRQQILDERTPEATGQTRGLRL